MKNLIFLLMFAVASCSGPATAGSGLDLKKGERVIIYDDKHRRTGTIENRGFGRTQIRDRNNRITGYIEGNRLYDRNNRRTGTVEKK